MEEECFDSNCKINWENKVLRKICEISLEFSEWGWKLKENTVSDRYTYYAHVHTHLKGQTGYVR